MAVITNTKTMNITVDHFNEIIQLLEKQFNNKEKNKRQTTLGTFRLLHSLQRLGTKM